MKIAVTGGRGFIGRCLVAALKAEARQVTVLSRRPDGVDTQVVRGDLTADDAPLDELVRDAVTVVHCAGELRDASRMRIVHVDGTRRLLAAAGREGQRTGRPIHWVQLSSVGAYGPPPGGAARARTVTEDTPVRPQGEYETTKTAADELVMEAAARGDITYTILRPSIVFGPSMPNNSLRQLGAVIRRRLFFYVGAPGAIATYVHVDDVVDALQRCARDSRACNQIFNLSNDCTVEQLVEGLAASSGVRPPRARLPERAVRLFVNAVGRFAPLPLTDARVDALVARTRYPFTKISKELGMSPSRFVPATVGDVFRSA